MQAVELPPFKRINSHNSLECSCEKFNLRASNKKITVCEICSEKKFLRQTSKPFDISDSISSSFSNSD